MERQIDIDQISDGKRYGLNDLVKVGCNDCQGCSSCCRGMGASIVLDPYDISSLELNLSCGFEELLAGPVELNVVDGIILPNLKMAGTGDSCIFLNKEGRCSIHGFRPGFCRMFPLGRIYEDGSFQYFLQVNECQKENKTKIKVRRWIDIPRFQEYEAFISEWHYLLKELQELVKTVRQEELAREASMFVLQLFFMKPYNAQADFYEQFAERLAEGRKYAASKRQQFGGV